MSPDRDLGRMGHRLLDAACAAAQFDTWQNLVFEVLQGIGYDVAFLKATFSSSAFRSRGFDEIVLGRARACWSRYEGELLPLLRAAEQRGVATDDEVLGPRRERLAYYRDVVAPHNGTSSLYARLAVSGLEVGAILLGRAGSPFTATDTDRMRGLLAPLSLGLTAQSIRWLVPQGGAGSRVLPISRREGEILELVQLGYTNPEIASALGTSPNTVRNQVSSLLRKLGATTRAELVGLTVSQ